MTCRMAVHAEYSYMLIGGDSIDMHFFRLIDQPTRTGWATCRLVEIIRRYDDLEKEDEIVKYVPEIHDNTSHYMSHPYKCRILSQENGKYRIKICWGGGSEGRIAWEYFGRQIYDDGETIVEEVTDEE